MTAMVNGCCGGRNSHRTNGDRVLLGDGGLAPGTGEEAQPGDDDNETEQDAQDDLECFFHEGVQERTRKTPQTPKGYNFVLPSFAPARIVFSSGPLRLCVNPS